MERGSGETVKLKDFKSPQGEVSVTTFHLIYFKMLQYSGSMNGSRAPVNKAARSLAGEMPARLIFQTRERYYSENRSLTPMLYFQLQFQLLRLKQLGRSSQKMNPFPGGCLSSKIPLLLPIL
jgi:hypothetical protein